MRTFPKSFLSILFRIVRSKHFVPLCLASCLIVRVLWIALIVSEPVSDFAWYYQRGLDISAGRGYAVDGIPTAYWPVGYPAFLGLIFSVFGRSLLVAKLANILLFAGILYLSYRIARNLFASELTGRLTLLFLAFYPNHIAYSSLLSCESLFLFLFLLGTILIMKCGKRLLLTAASGLVFGLACLVKSQALFVPAILILFLRPEIKGRSLKQYLVAFTIVYAVLMLTISPWIVRNYYEFSNFVYISNNGGITLLIGNNPYANGTYIPFNGKVASLLEPAENEREIDVRARNYAINYICEHPVRTIGLWPVKFWHIFNEDVEGVNWNVKGIDSKGKDMDIFFWYFTGLAQNYYICTVTVFLVSLPVLFMKRKRNGRAIPTAGLWVIGYFTAIYLITIGISRFHFPFIPWIMMYIAAMFEMVASRFSIISNTDQCFHSVL